MKQIVSSRQMKELDQYTIEQMGVPSLVLMERASLAVVEELKKDFDLTKVLVVCGPGNNGGDGIAVARLLHLEGYRVDLYLCGKKESFTEEADIQWKIAGNYGISLVKTFCPPEYTTIVDAVFGVGLSREISPSHRELFEKINDSRVPVLAVDIPSGIQGTTGRMMGSAIRAKKTVTFAFGKKGLYLYPGAEYAGQTVVKDIGIYGKAEDGLYALDEEEYCWLPPRPQAGNKGTFGKVLIAAGSKNMSGAAYFAAKACLLSGAGMVRIFTPESNRVILQQQFPEAMLTTYEPEEAKETILAKLEKARLWADVEAVGPGLGTSREAKWILEEFFRGDAYDAHGKKPLVIDADGLNLLSVRMELLKNCKRPCILTPHMGEMTRLSGFTMEELKKEPEECLRSFQEKFPVITVLKDARTFTGIPGGNRFLNLTGNSGMATAGSGDVLTGMTAGLLAQKILPEQAAPLAVWLHGKAGDLAREKKGERSMTASDLLEAIPTVLQPEKREMRK
ncbi:MAG: NAD(P)H-hydrate dehydratase [Clostridiales bacterium]|nr:NAD(P)H-hydrate dehydratase [Clostridiales bacterium]